jgi:hypothetical protein
MSSNGWCETCARVDSYADGLTGELKLQELLRASACIAVSNVREWIPRLSEILALGDGLETPGEPPG